MIITCIGQGSQGNCFHVRFDNGETCYLDAGMPPKALLENGDAIAGVPVFVTHEHGDHAKYAKELYRKYGAIIYSRRMTLEALGMGHVLTNTTQIHVRTIPVIHNAVDPVCFYLECAGESLLYLVDAGQVPDVSDLRPDVLIVEANYTPKRLQANIEQSDSDLFVGARVSSGFGHLSANQACEVAKPMLPSLDMLLLTHISERNFDYDELLADPTISQEFKDLATVAQPNEVMQSIPF